MLEYLIGLSILFVMFLVPPTRKAVLSVLGVSAIALIAIAGIALPVWGLYEAKSWLISSEPGGAKMSSTTSADEPIELVAGQGGSSPSPQQKEEQRRLEEEERKREAEEARRLDAEQRRIAGVVEQVRSIVEKDRKYAAVAESSPRLPGLEQVSADLVRIRIPSWRDGELAEREKELILAWLSSIGVTPLEMEGIHTANGWGSVYDLWRQEQAVAAGGDAPTEQVPVAEVPDQVPPPVEPAPQPEPEPGSESQPPPQQADSRIFPDRTAVDPNPQPRRVFTPPRRTAPERPPSPVRQVGPFGY